MGYYIPWFWICQGWGDCHYWNSTIFFPSQNVSSNKAPLNCQHTPKLEFCYPDSSFHGTRFHLYLLPFFMPAMILQTASQHYICVSLGCVGEKTFCPYKGTPFQVSFVQPLQTIISTVMSSLNSTHHFLPGFSSLVNW